MNEEPMIVRLVLGMCQDTNYQIRTEGAIFMKEYLQANHEKLVGTERFEEVYLPEIYELLNDEESYVRIEAIEAIAEVLEHVEVGKIEEEFMPNFLKALDFENNHDEIIVRMSKMIGPLSFKLSKHDLHLKYKEPILTFYKTIINHKEEENVMSAVYNLPCFHQLYKDVCSPPKPLDVPGTAATQSTGITVQNTHENDDLLDNEEFK